MVVDLGTITAERLVSDNLIQQNIASDVILLSAGTANLNRPEVVRSIDTKGDLTALVPGVDAVEVHQGVPEGQKVGITDAKAFSHPIELEKDSAIISLTDEAVIRTSAHGFSAFEYLKEQAANKLAALQDMRILEALNQTPQTGNEINLKTADIYDAVAQVDQKFDDFYKITALICSREARARIFHATNVNAFTGSNPSQPYDDATIPGTNIPIITTTAVNKSGLGNQLFFVSSEVPAAMWASGQVATHAWRDEEADKVLYRIDAYRGCESNFVKTDDNKNMGVVKIQWKYE